MSALEVMESVTAINKVHIEISVVLGRSRMPIHQLLKMGRGAVIELDAQQDEEIWVLANNIPIARGEIVVQGDKIAVSITDKIRNFESIA
ncbi:surface presentation of antigens (SPOA) protein [Tepidicaulis marinus]|jgi:flagellar motor switch protein FliN/FliY|uniref:Surface presentation of antigens (SPOA) protein n=1 Tax=Tepidicaulis marinus TaxID=1333998 RepID=A0A081BEC5_9HYPH|nr:FliM/FliN family flagellar motor switch protein [Tepidicaulis marinus]GAK46393.1 surface presentation of antigens (SPOA) protein [Tepidicaulis marinus]